MAKGILIAAMDFSAAPEDASSTTGTTSEHIPERLRIKGFINADRWIATDNPKRNAGKTYDLR